MSLNFQTAQARMATGILRDDLAPNYGEYLNEALQEIQNRRDWTFMKASIGTPTDPFILPSGDHETVANLPAAFKGLQKRTSVFFIADGYGDVLSAGLIPAEVVYRNQQIFRIFTFWGTPIITWPPRVFVERWTNPDGTIRGVLGMVEPRKEDFKFQVNYYQYLPALVNPDDESPFLTAYPQMVLNKAKEIAFRDINDSMSDEYANKFEANLAAAVRQDAYNEVSGRELRM